MNIDVEFCRERLRLIHIEVRKLHPDVKLKEAWVYNLGNDHWEFHGPDDYYWHGSAGNAYEARANGWGAWLDKDVK